MLNVSWWNYIDRLYCCVLWDLRSKFYQSNLYYYILKNKEGRTVQWVHYPVSFGLICWDCDPRIPGTHRTGFFFFFLVRKYFIKNHRKSLNVMCLMEIFFGLNLFKVHFMLVLINEEHIFRCVLIRLHFFIWSFWIVMCLPKPFITKINKNTQPCTSLGSIEY